MLCDHCGDPLDEVWDDVEPEEYCEICGYNFCTSVCYGEHVETEHGGSGPDPLALPDDSLVDEANRILREAGGVNGLD